MKKLITMLLALTMVVTLAVSGAAPVFADEATPASNIAPGGIYATKVWGNLNMTPHDQSYSGWPYTVDTVNHSFEISVNDTDDGNTNNWPATRSIDLSGVKWENRGYLVLEYDVTLTSYNSTTEGKNFHVGAALAPKSSSWIIASTMDPYTGVSPFTSAEQVGNTVSIKQIYRFNSDSIEYEVWKKAADAQDYTMTSSGVSSQTVSSYVFTGVYPVVRSHTCTGTATIDFSNIKITEVYEEAKLQSFDDTFAPTDVVNIGINLPADYASAKLTIGGVEYADMTADSYAAGAYTVTADLSELTYCSNFPVVLDIVKADGTKEKLTSSISVIIGPDMTSYGVEDFEDETYLYSFTTADNIGITDIPAATGRTGKAYGVTTRNNNNGSQIKLDFPSPYIAEGTCVDINFDVYLTGMYSHLQLYMKDLDNSAQWNTVMGWGASVPLNDAKYGYLLGKWIDVKLTVDTVNNCVDIYCEGEYIATKSITNHTMNGLKSVWLSPKVTSQADHFIYIDNVEFSSYIPGNKPAVASVTTNHDNGTIALAFDSAVAYTEGSITLDGIASTVAYDEETFTATITPTGDMTTLNGTIVVAESVAGYAMTIPATLPVELPFISNMALTVSDGTYTGTVDVYNDGVEDLGKIYVAIYNGSNLVKVVSAPVVTVNGAATFSAPLTPDAAGTYNAQMFFWDADLSPVTGVVTPR